MLDNVVTVLSIPKNEILFAVSALMILSVSNLCLANVQEVQSNICPVGRNGLKKRLV